MQRLDKYLAHASGLPRKRVRAVIRQGRVRVDGVVIRDSAHPVDDPTVMLDGEVQGARIEIAVFHKATGTHCTVGDPIGRRSLTEAAHQLLDLGLHPVGRLDADTSGLLVFARDGQLTQRLLHPRHKVYKTYQATVEGDIDPGLVQRLAEGVETAHGIHPARVDSIDGQVVTLSITLGKYRIVRRMLANAGHPVTALHRVRLGGFSLDGLEEETWREATEEEIAWAEQLTSGALKPKKDSPVPS
ncbi:MAG: 23S rRNA pseudouridine2605 synthase [Myxococcota bacterium]|jgi:23S rRNA pseudouridine2605 synthase